VTESEFVENAEALTAVFGEWPSFHDAEVLSMYLDRAGSIGPTLDARIHVFRMTSEVDSRGFYVITHHTLVTLRFVNIVLQQLHWFNHQNVLSDLLLERAGADDAEHRCFRAQFGSSWGVEAELLCDQIIVVAVEPYTPPA
jgi:hypothetical protein